MVLLPVRVKSSRHGRCIAPLLTTALLWLLTSSVSAAQLFGVVVALADGDTLTVLDGSNTQHKVRLSGIDAPEKSQAYGDLSRMHLAELVFRRQVVVEWTKRDKYGRVVGKVFVDGLDSGFAQVEAGLAWHYKAYQREQSTEDRVAYQVAEDAARSKRMGLWKDPSSIPPWNFRHLLHR